MNYCGMITVSDKTADAGCRHLGIFLGEIHRHLAGEGKVCLAGGGEDLLLADLKDSADGLEDVVGRQGAALDGDRPTDDPSGGLEVHLSRV